VATFSADVPGASGAVAVAPTRGWSPLRVTAPPPTASPGTWT